MYKTLAAVLKGKWLIDPEEAVSLLPIVTGLIKGDTSFEKKEPELRIGIIGGNGVGKASMALSHVNPMAGEKLSAGTTVIIPIEGAMMKNDQMCGNMGMISLSNIVKELDANPNISAIVFQIDSPGGQVDGTQTLANAIKNCQTPTIAFINDGCACSAAYWIASSCNELYVGLASDRVGSIGVYCTIADFKEAYKAKGITVMDIYSRLSGEKNKAYREAVEGNTALIQDQLDFTANLFIDAVKANRPNISLAAGDPFKGKVFTASDALAIGLIDGIKTFEEIISQINMTPESSKPVATEVVTEEVAIANETTESMVAEFIAAMSDTSSLNAVLAVSNTILIAKEEHEELIALRDYKVKTEAWKLENNITHSAGVARVDDFVENIEENALEKMIADEQAYVAAKYDL